MAWHLPEKRKQLLRVYTEPLCSDKWSWERRRYLLYLILRPALGWLKREFIAHDLEPDEAESEIFLLVSRLFSGYDASKSCFLYHIERSIPWKVSRLLEKIAKENKKELIELQEEETYEMGEEAYLSIPNVLFEDRWLVRGLSQYEKTLILRMLIENQPSCRALANSCQVGESTMKRDLQILAGKLKGRLL